MMNSYYALLSNLRILYCVRGNSVAILQMRNPDLVVSQFEPSSAYIQGHGFFTA